MNIILGLGNPGQQYDRTRHNIGFDLLDRLQQQWHFPEFALNKKFNALVSEGAINGVKTLLAKPQTFMNLSGISVRAILDFYKLTPQDFLIIQDELDLPIGTHKISVNSSAAGHNGIKSIIEHFGTQDFARLRIGIGNQHQNTACLRGAHDFVLDRFSQEEQTLIDSQFDALLAKVEEKIK